MDTDLPTVHCHFCNCVEERALIKSVTHNIYLCNSGASESESHAFYYLRHFPHAAFEKQGKKIQCSKCQDTNIYSLGYVDNENHMICKRCLTKGERGQKLRDLAQKWRPLVSGMVIDRNVVPCPKEACEVTKEQMKQQLAVIKSKSSRAPLPELVRLGLEEKSGKSRV